MALPIKSQLTMMQNEKRRRDYKMAVERAKVAHKQGMSGDHWRIEERIEIFLLDAALHDPNHSGLKQFTVRLPISWHTAQAIRDAPLHQLQHTRRVQKDNDYRIMVERKRLERLEHIQDLEDAPDYFVDALGNIQEEE